MGLTPLALAVTRDNTEIARLLIEAGADARDAARPFSAVRLAQDKPEILSLIKAANGTNLHDAAKAGDLAAVTALLTNGADVDARDEDGRP